MAMAASLHSRAEGGTLMANCDKVGAAGGSSASRERERAADNNGIWHLVRARDPRGHRREKVSDRSSCSSAQLTSAMKD